MDFRVTRQTKVDLVGETVSAIIANLAMYGDRHGFDVLAKLDMIKEHVPRHHQAVYEYQAAVLMVCASWYNHDDARIIEFGTGRGYSTAALSAGAPNAVITTLSPNKDELVMARQQLKAFTNIRFLNLTSTEFMAHEFNERGMDRPRYDMIFIDGDHKNVVSDAGSWGFLKPGGLWLHHDYSPYSSRRAVPPVWKFLNYWKQHVIEREFDVLVVDRDDVGMAGWIR